MLRMRVYLPGTAADLELLKSNASELTTTPALPRRGFAVTKSLVAANPGLDQDELEWEAFDAAATDSASLLLSDPAAVPMRVVLSFELPPATISEVTGDDARQFAAVAVSSTPSSTIAAIHVDEPNTAALIKKLRADPDSASTLAEVLDADLLWYDPSEVEIIPLPQ